MSFPLVSHSVLCVKEKARSKQRLVCPWDGHAIPHSKQITDKAEEPVSRFLTCMQPAGSGLAHIHPVCWIAKAEVECEAVQYAMLS